MTYTVLVCTPNAEALPHTAQNLHTTVQLIAVACHLLALVLYWQQTADCDDCLPFRRWAVEGQPGSQRQGRARMPPNTLELWCVTPQAPAICQSLSGKLLGSAA